MCAGYGLELRGPNSGGGDRVGRLGPIPPGDTAEGAALLAAWASERGGAAKITGRKALNLNPLIRAGADGRSLELGWWWLHVGGEPARFSAFNSRADRLLASWHASFQQRAILPATWYIEKGVRFGLGTGDEFGLAAVTAPGTLPDGSPVTSYSLVTRDAVGEAASVHDRMPLVLPRDLHDEWLSPERPGDASLVTRALAQSEALCAAMLGAAGGSGRERSRGAARPGSDAPTLF